MLSSESHVLSLDNNYKQIELKDNELILKIQTMSKKNIYLKYKKNTKTFSDIKNFIFDNIKYSYNHLHDKKNYTFKFNDILISKIITNDLHPIETSLEGSVLLDKLANAKIPLKLIFNPEIIKNFNYQIEPTTNEIIDTKIKFGLKSKDSDSEENISEKNISEKNISEKNISEENIKEEDKSNIKTIYIKTLTGKTKVLHCNPFITTVNNLKTAIYLQEEISLDQQRIIYNGKQLEDGYLLSNYIKNSNEVTMHIVLRLRGGMYSEVSGRNGSYQPLTDLYYDIDDTIKIDKIIQSRITLNSLELETNDIMCLQSCIDTELLYYEICNDNKKNKKNNKNLSCDI